ncbi:hypothetical protein DL93DRAFT_2231312 [Clavulina sp. PMI_390]|nr:hypothetical protein DL93DRAFT_2231312 [Clavulina sp. PMI_390]
MTSRTETRLPAILQQPVESLDAIALEIDTAKDLLSLALSCKALHALVYARHLRFRVISARLEDRKLLPVWDLLARDKTLARSVRVLDLQPLAHTDPRFLIPLAKEEVLALPTVSKSKKTPKRPPYELLADVVENHFAPALSNMSRLLNFSWKEVHHPYIFVKGSKGSQSFDGRDVLQQIWHALNHARTLRRVSIIQKRHLGDGFFKNIQLDGLTELTWESSEPHNDEVSWRIMEGIYFPNLERLSIHFPCWFGTPKWHNTLKDVYWPFLRRIEFAGWIPDPDGILYHFLKRHTTLEELVFWLLNLPPPDFTGPFLPNLRALSTYPNPLADLVRLISSPLLNTITVANGQRWFHEIFSMADMADALRLHPSIVHVNIDQIRAYYKFELLVEALPGLKSVNGIAFSGDLEALRSSLRRLEGDLADDDEIGIFGALSLRDL